MINSISGLNVRARATLTLSCQLHGQISMQYVSLIIRIRVRTTGRRHRSKFAAVMENLLSQLRQAAKVGNSYFRVQAAKERIRNCNRQLYGLRC